MLALWLLGCAFLVYYKWNGIVWFALGDTDDNIRFAQVQAWLNGQGWYDLRQYRLDPPLGASIHWSRLVDLPIAGLILLLKPFVGTFAADKAAVAIAPLLSLGGAMFGLAVAVRRLVDRESYVLAMAILACAQAALLMWMPLRIDHHGWQLATLIFTLAGLADEKPVRGALTVALATSFSLVIGLEFLPYAALAAGVLALRWVWNAGDEAVRLRVYGASLAIGCAVGFALFASYDNRAPRCDALTPVWLSVALGGGGLLVLLSSLTIADRRLRFAAAFAAGALLSAGFALAWPDCLGRPEHMSPELQKLWFSNIREAKPLYLHGWRTALPIIALPAVGVAGSLLALWRARNTERFAAWAAAALFSIFSCGMLLWQTRAGPSAQLLAVPGATALGWMLLPRLLDHRLMIVRLFGTVAAFLLVSGLFMFFTLKLVPQPPVSEGRRVVNRANGRCPTLAALRPIAALPPATIFTFVDFGPRLIATTHHSAIAGPYHRNGDAILDVQHAFRGDAETAHRIMLKHHATLLLLCPGMSESTIYAAQAKNGFYVQLMRDEVPAWLQPMPLPPNSPFRLWRITG